MPSLVEEALALRARYDEEPSHSDQVARLALQIYDGLNPWHGLEERMRDLLHVAALLHDIGWSQTPDGKGHHKWSARLIQEQNWAYLKKEEVPVVAQVARYHRKAIPQRDHAEFQNLDKEARRHVMILGGILRQADALDRTHTGKIEQIKMEITPKALRFGVRSVGIWEAERAMFESKREMLELAAERRVVCEESGA